MKKWTVERLKQAIIEYTEEISQKEFENSSTTDVYYALSTILKNDITSQWSKTRKQYHEQKPKQVFYLSMEFLIGGLLKSNLLNQNILHMCNEALTKLGLTPDEVDHQEHDPGLGNGGLGRLAACFLDSMASLNYPGHGYGIRYQYGLFEQRLINGYQTELPDYWLESPYPWEIRRDDEIVHIEYGGSIEMKKDQAGDLEFHYHN